MASSQILIRRSLRSLSGLHHSFSATATCLSVPITGSISSPLSLSKSINVLDSFQSCSFRSTLISLLSSRYRETSQILSDDDDDEGCDYNHWLILIDFPEDNAPTPEEMICLYEETCAKGLNISGKEAKKMIYASCTTTYAGFHAVMTEEESKKFEGMPGVIRVFPDYNIDHVTVNKQYGGDDDDDEIDDGPILVEGRDYNHWFIVFDFPKDNKPTPAEMICLYEETCAKGLNISVEEAKKKIYACKTTTYPGFQAVMTEEESKKFEGMPGVIHVLPDYNTALVTTPTEL